jgi:sensor histidine kinase regulating citrate/malate metabolism
MPEKIKFFSSLQFKIVLLITIFSAVLMGSVILYLERDIRQSMIAESVEKGLGIARGVAFNAEDPLLTGDDLYLFSAVNIARKSQGVV